MRPLGIYIHIPFCRSKCRYCDFCSHPPVDGEIADYVEKLCAEIGSWRDRMASYTADTVYFGGGTPSLLTPGQVGDVLGALAHSVSVAQNAEITLECNPATASETALREIRRAGVNRLSIGAQSLDDAELRALGRLHDAAAVGETVGAARRAGFDNISLDLMYGIPLQTRDSLASTLRGVLDMAPEHVSAYGLRVEPDTPFGRMGDRLSLPCEDDVADMYLDVCDALGSAGILQYEISNFSRAGRESRHNLKYWHCDEYLGFGLAASSFFGGVRFTAARDMAGYAAGQLSERTVLTPADREVEYVMLALRLCEGVRYDDYAARFGMSAAKKYSARLARYASAGLVNESAGGFALTRRGMLVSNSILADILDL